MSEEKETASDDAALDLLKKLEKLASLTEKQSLINGELTHHVEHVYHILCDRHMLLERKHPDQDKIAKEACKIVEDIWNGYHGKNLTLGVRFLHLIRDVSRWSLKQAEETLALNALKPDAGECQCEDCVRRREVEKAKAEAASPVTPVPMD